MIFAIPFPAIDPVALDLGFFQVRWYALAYIAGILLGWRYARWVCRRSPEERLTPEIFDDFVLWAMLAVVIGGRLGYVIFYQPERFLAAPWEILYVWQGGMSFHGGLLGVLAAIWLYARRLGIGYFALSDVIGAAVPIGLFLGRIANFVNGELFGRPGDVPWAMVFPHGGDEPRHPSQLYEAGLEGLLLFLVLFVMIRLGALERIGVVSGTFMLGYGLARGTAEFFREPDPYLGFLFAGATMGQLLSLPMILVGLWILWWSLKRR